MATNSRKRPYTLLEEASAAANQLPAPTQKAQKTTNISDNSPANHQQQQLGLNHDAQLICSSCNHNAQLICSTCTSSKPSAKKSAPNAPSKAFYLTTIAAIDKKLASLDEICEIQNPNHAVVNSDDYAQAMSAFLTSIKEQLLQQFPPLRDSLILAFKLLLYMGEHAHAALDLGPKMCGYGDSEPEYEKMDLVMMEVLDLLDLDEKEQDLEAAAAAPGGTTASTTMTTDDGAAAAAPNGGDDLRWDPDTHGDVGEYKTGRPSKQQRDLLEKQKAIWEEERLKQRRESRESSSGTDLLTKGLKQLKRDRDEIEPFGLDGYFSKSIARLEELLRT